MSNGQASTIAISDEELARAHVYQLLGRLLARPPDQQVLTLISSIEDQAPDDDAPLTVAWRELRRAAAAAQPALLEQEYFKLFIGLGRGELLPYASWYVHGALMERILANLRQDLKRLGFARQDEVAEPEDHAAALCETLGMIISDPGLSLEQAAFFQAYVDGWMGRFFADLEAAETADFYRAVGQLGSRFMELEKRLFALPAD
jgi:TorA maturation chaperone TorD